MQRTGKPTCGSCGRSFPERAVFYTAHVEAQIARDDGAKAIETFERCYCSVCACAVRLIDDIVSAPSQGPAT